MDDLDRGYQGYPLNPHYVRTFYYAALCKSFTRAAERMSFTSQSAVSQHVRHLELQLGKLFERRARGVELTPKGRILFELVSPPVEAFEKLKTTLDARCAEAVNLRVTVVRSSKLDLDFLARVFTTFHQRNPSVEVVVLEDVDPHAMVATGKADFGLMVLSRTLPELQYEQLVPDKPVLITSIGVPISTSDSPELLEEICGLPYVKLARGSGTQRRIDDVFRRHHLELRVTLEVGTWQDVKRVVSLGLGVSIVPNLLLSARDSNLAAIPISNEFSGAPWGIAFRRGSRLSRPVQELMAQVVAAFAALPEDPVPAAPVA